MATESYPDVSLAPNQEPPAATVAAPLLRQWWVAFSASTVFVVCGHLMIKAGLNTASLHTGSASFVGGILRLLLQPEVIGGLSVYLLGTVCWMTAVAQREISFLYPLTSINYVMVVATSFLFFHEFVPMRRIMGVAVIVLGMILMNRKSSKRLA